MKPKKIDLHDENQFKKLSQQLVNYLFEYFHFDDLKRSRITNTIYISFFTQMGLKSLRLTIRTSPNTVSISFFTSAFSAFSNVDFDEFKVNIIGVSLLFSLSVN